MKELYKRIKNYFQSEKTLGEKGEEIALTFLKSSGYKIKERNFTCKLGELDIIAGKEGKHIFVEVKTRQSEDYGKPVHSVDYDKKRKIIQIAKHYLSSRGLMEEGCRFDVIGIILADEDNPEIKHYEGAFRE